MNSEDGLKKYRQEEAERVGSLLKKQNELLGQTLFTLDHFLFLHKSISRLNLGDIKEVLIDKLPDILGIRYFSLFLFNKNQRTLTLACHNQPSLKEGITFPMKESGVMYDALTQGRYILESDFTKSKYFSGKRNPLFKNDFFVCIPLMIENEMIGVINLNDNDRGTFSVNDLDFMLNVMEFISLSISNALLYEKTELLSVTDGLTMLNNHQRMQEILKSEFERSRRYKAPLSLVMMDVDHFKKVNDTYGHQVGDEILMDLASVITGFCRANDSAARYGGEEFILILPETNVEGAFQIAERIRQEVATHRYQPNGTAFGVTISCGVAELKLPEVTNSAHLIQMADRALYRAKNDGRNCTRIGDENDLD